MKRLAPVAPLLSALLWSVSCGKGSGAIAPAEPTAAQAGPAQAAPIEIRELFPPVAAAGIPFQAIPDGSSTIGVAGNGFTRTAQVFFDDRPLRTNFQSPKALAAVVPNELILTPRTVSLTIRDRNPDRASAPATFTILPPKQAGDPAVVKELFPPSTQAGKGFGVQPDGRYALGISGTGFEPECVVVFDGAELKTTVQSPLSMVAFVPPELVQKARSVKVVVRPPDAKAASSAPAVFEIKP